MGDVPLWLVWFVAAVGCLGSGVAVISFSNPFLGDRPDREPRLAGRPGLLLSAEFLAAAQVLVYAGAVMVMFLFVIALHRARHRRALAGGPSWMAIAAVVAAGVNPRRRCRRDRLERRRPSLRLG